MKITRIVFCGLIILSAMIFTPAKLLAAPSSQAESDEVIQIVLILDVSGSMGTPVYTGIVPEDLLSLLLRLGEITNDSQFIDLNELVNQAADDPELVATKNAWADAFEAMNDWVAAGYEKDITAVQRDVEVVLTSYGCETNVAHAIATAGSTDQIDLYLNAACSPDTVTAELRQEITDQIPYLADPEYLALRETWQEAFRTYDEALETSGYNSASQELEEYKTSGQYYEIQDEIDRLNELYDIPSRLELAKSAAINLIDLSHLDKTNTGRDSLLGLVTFSNQAMFEHALTLEHEQLKKLIRALTPQEQTNIGDALTMGLNELMRNTDPEQPLLVILLSDGHANVGMSSSEILAAIPPRANDLDVTLCTAGFADIEPEVDFVLLEGLAEQTEGEYLFTNSGAELGSFFVACRESAAGMELAGQITGVVEAGQNAEVGTVAIESNTCELNLALNFLSGTPLIELFDPEGTLIEASQEDVTYQTSNNVQLLSVQNPGAGEWVINITNDDAEETAATFSILVSTSQCTDPAPAEIIIDPMADLPFLLSEAGMPFVTAGVILIVLIFTGGVFYLILRRQKSAE